MNWKTLFRIATVVTIVMVVTLPMKGVIAQQVNEEEVPYELEALHEDSDANEKFNPSNPDPNKVNFIDWKKDFSAEERETPKGSYVGQYLTPSVAQLDYKNSYDRKVKTVANSGSDWQGSVTYDAGNLNIMTVSTEKEFSSREIMNGASQFWVKCPVQYDQLEVLNLTTKWNHKNDDHHRVGEYSTTIHSGLYMFEGSHQKFDISGETTSGLFDLRGEEDIGQNLTQPQLSRANYIINKNNNYNNSVYQEVNAIVESDKKYTFTFLIITEGKPQVKFDEVQSDSASMNMFNLEVEKPSGYTSRIIGPTRINFIETNFYDFSVKESRDVSLPVNPHFSFIFTRGLGRNGLFGTKLDSRTDVAISSIKDGSNADSGDYPSFYLPFRYNSPEGGISPELTVRIGDSEGNILLSRESLNSVYDWSTNEKYEAEYGFSFSRFLLYSSEKYNHKRIGDNSAYTGKMTVKNIYHNLPKNLTFLCHPRNDDYRYTKRGMPTPSSIEGRSFAVGQLASHWYGESWRTGKVNETMISDTVEKNNKTIITRRTDYDKISERYFYDIHQSMRFTEGRWNTLDIPPKIEYISSQEAVERGIPYGMTINMRHRDYIIRVEDNVEKYLNLRDKKIGQNKEKLSYWISDKPLLNPIKTIKGISGWLLYRISSVVTDVMNKMRQALDKLWGSITSFLSDVWEKMKGLGEWIKRTVMNVVDVITKVAGELYELGGMIMSALQYTFVLMSIILATFAVGVTIESAIGRWKE